MACTSPPEVDNGYVSFSSLSPDSTNGWASGTSIKYECSKYFCLVDSDTLTCNTGSWTGTTPGCEYCQTTEIVFGILIALFILLLLLLLLLLIFLCCYFCACCKKYRCCKKDDDDDAEIGRRRRGSSAKSYRDRNGGHVTHITDTHEDRHSAKEHTRTVVYANKQYNEREASDVSDSAKKKRKSRCSPCCFGCCTTTEGSGTRRDSRTEYRTEDNRTTSEPVASSSRGTDSSTSNERNRELRVVEDHEEIKPSGCCVCCKTTEGRGDRQPRPAEETRPIGYTGTAYTSTTYPLTSQNNQTNRTNRTATQRPDSRISHVTTDDEDDGNTGCCVCCRVTKGKPSQRTKRVGSEDRLGNNQVHPKPAGDDKNKTGTPKEQGDKNKTETPKEQSAKDNTASPKDQENPSSAPIVVAERPASRKRKAPTEYKPQYVAAVVPVVRGGDDQERIFNEEYKRLEDEEKEKLKEKEKQRLAEEEKKRKAEEEKKRLLDEKKRKEQDKLDKEKLEAEEKKRQLEEKRKKELERLEQEREAELQNLDKQLAEEKKVEEEKLKKAKDLEEERKKREKENEEERQRKRDEMDEKQRQEDDEKRRELEDKMAEAERRRKEKIEKEKQEREERRRQLEERMKAKEEKVREAFRQAEEIQHDDVYAESSGYGSPSHSPKRRRKMKNNEVQPRFLQYNKKGEKFKAEPKPIWRYWPNEKMMKQ